MAAQARLSTPSWQERTFDMRSLRRLAIWGASATVALTIAVVAVVILHKLTAVTLPKIPVAWNQATFFGTIAVGVLLLIKLISETSYLGFGAWLGIILGAGMVFGGFQISREPEETPVGGSGMSPSPPPPPPPPGQ